MGSFALGVGLFVLVLLAAASTHAEQGIFESFGAHTLLLARTLVGPTVAFL